LSYETIYLMKLFKNPIVKSNFLVFVFFLVLTIIAVTFSGCDNSEPTKIIIKSKNITDTSSNDGANLYDSVYFNNAKYIDSIKKLED